MMDSLKTLFFESHLACCVEQIIAVISGFVTFRRAMKKSSPMCVAHLLLCSASAFTVRSPAITLSSVAPRTVGRSPAIAMQMFKKKSRFADDGTREKGTDLMSGVDQGLSKGLFSGFKWGTEVDVMPTVGASKKKATKGMAKDNSDRGLGGNQSYRNTESARLSSADPGQRIRKAKLEAYITSDEAPADKTIGKILSGSLILTILALLGGVVAYYGIDGLVFAGSGGKYDSLNLTI